MEKDTQNKFLDLVGLSVLSENIKNLFVTKNYINSQYILSDEEPTTQKVGDIWDKIE